MFGYNLFSHGLCIVSAFLIQDCKRDELIGDGYEYINEMHSSYKFHKGLTLYSWIHAKAACERENATLFFPENKSEAQTVIRHFWSSWTFDKIFIGIAKPTVIRNQIGAAEGFITMDGRALEDVYSYWDLGQPDNLESNEYCLCMSKLGYLHDYPCDTSYLIQFICKKTQVTLSNKAKSSNSDKLDKPAPRQLSFKKENSKPDKFFRKGYKYLEETKSFYKIHTISRNWHDARTTCEQEGATLFYPQDVAEANVVISYWNYYFQSSFQIYIGISAHNVMNVYETIDGLSIEVVYNKWAPGEPSGGSESCVILRRDGLITDDDCDLSWPFICKKTEASLRWNDRCDLPDPEYIYHKTTDRCYKLHLTPKSWRDAYTTCSIEESKLAVINSDEEAKIFVDMIKNSRKNLLGHYVEDAAYLGFKYDDGWKTYQGTYVSSSGYAEWDDGQPDRSGNKTCGAMLYNGRLSAVHCEDERFFICVHP